MVCKMQWTLLDLSQTSFVHTELQHNPILILLKFQNTRKKLKQKKTKELAIGSLRGDCEREKCNLVGQRGTMVCQKTSE